MRHLKAGNRLGVNTAHRRAIMRNMVTSILENGQITCTLARAKEVRKPLEKMIGWGKLGNLHARRQALRFVKSKEAMTQLFEELADRYKDRQGGYCRIIKLGKTRLGDNSEMAIIQLLRSEADQLSKLKSQTGKKKKPKKKESSVLKEVSEEIKTESSSSEKSDTETTSVETKIETKKEKTQAENETVKGVPSADTAPVEKETEQKREVEVTTNTVQEKIESDTKTKEEIPVEDSIQDESEAELDKGEVKAEPAQTQEEAEATSAKDDIVETNSEKNY